MQKEGGRRGGRRPVEGGLYASVIPLYEKGAAASAKVRSKKAKKPKGE